LNIVYNIANAIVETIHDQTKIDLIYCGNGRGQLVNGDSIGLDYHIYQYPYTGFSHSNNGAYIPFIIQLCIGSNGLMLYYYGERHNRETLHINKAHLCNERYDYYTEEQLNKLCVRITTIDEWWQYHLKD